MVLNKIDDRTFTVRYGVYLKGDGICCPSREQTDTYVWFSKDGAFKRIRSVKGPRKEE